MIGPGLMNIYSTNYVEGREGCYQSRYMPQLFFDFEIVFNVQNGGSSILPFFCH